MKYMLIMTSNTKAFDEMAATWSEQEIKAMIAFMGRFGAELAESGELVDAQGLAHPNQAKVVQAQKDDGPMVTDGPFPEAKEFLAGYWLVDVRDEARAIELADRISSGDGTFPVYNEIVVHPIGEAPQG